MFCWLDREYQRSNKSLGIIKLTLFTYTNVYKIKHIYNIYVHKHLKKSFGSSIKIFSAFSYKNHLKVGLAVPLNGTHFCIM